jgi:3-oxoacyl-[acyl-carrier protein] reductase
LSGRSDRRALDFHLQEDDLDLGLKDRVAIVTGGSRGIGKACAVELLAEGASVVLVSKNSEANAAAVRELGKGHPDRVLGIPTDLGGDAGVAAMTAQAVARFGRIDILVNSAATVIPQDFFKMGDGEMTDLLEQKFIPAARCIRHAVPHMRQRKWGRIINISGLAGRQPHYPVVPAALNNSAMLNLTKALAAELARDNILVNAVVPYIINTERQDDTMREWAQTTGQTEAEVRRRRVSRLPVGRMGRPDEVAGVVAFMASERSSYVVGTAWYVDGGGAMTL